MAPKPTTVVPFDNLDGIGGGGPDTGESTSANDQYRPTAFEDDIDDDDSPAAARGSQRDANGGGRSAYSAVSDAAGDDASDGSSIGEGGEPEAVAARRGSARKSAHPSFLSPIAASPIEGELTMKRGVNIPLMRLDSLEAPGGAGDGGTHEEAKEALPSSDGSRSEMDTQRSGTAASATAATQSTRRNSFSAQGAQLAPAGSDGAAAAGGGAGSTRELTARELTARANSVRDDLRENASDAILSPEVRRRAVFPTPVHFFTSR